MSPNFRVGIGQDSHRFLPNHSTKLCLIGGVVFEETPGLDADSDGDVVLHAICNAITSLTGVPILGKVAIELCHKDGITDSRVYVQKALDTLGPHKIQHVALSIEGKRPRLQPRIDAIRATVATLLHIDFSQVGLTATSGDGLTDFGCGDGLQCFCILTTM